MDSSAASVDEAILEGERLVRSGQLAPAIEKLRPLLADAPADYRLNINLGQAHAGLGQLDAALERFEAAAAADRPDPIGALYEIVRIDLLKGDFGRVGLLDQALAMPGDLACRLPATNEKRDHYFQIRLIQGLLAVHEGDYGAGERHVSEAYAFAKSPFERFFAYDWSIQDFRSAPDLTDYPHLDYLRHIFLRLNMSDAIDYEAALEAVQGQANVLEIGAMDGVRFDSLYRHVVDKRWKTVVVEPIPDMFALLQQNYASCDWVRCANVAITEENGPLTMYRVRPDVVASGGPDWFLGMSSAIKGPHLDYIESTLEEVVVPGLTFDDFAQRFEIDRIDVLQIDTEGYDWRILRQIDLQRWKVGLIRVELIHLPLCDRLKVFETLRAAGYSYTYDGSDLTAVRKAD